MGKTQQLAQSLASDTFVVPGDHPEVVLHDSIMEQLAKVGGCLLGGDALRVGVGQAGMRLQYRLVVKRTRNDLTKKNIEILNPIHSTKKHHKEEKLYEENKYVHTYTYIVNRKCALFRSYRVVNRVKE